MSKRTQLNATIEDLFVKRIYEQKLQELQDLRNEDQKNNTKNFSYRSWKIIFETLEFIFNNTPIQIYNRNNQKKIKKKEKVKKGPVNESRLEN